MGPFNEEVQLLHGHPEKWHWLRRHAVDVPLAINSSANQVQASNESGYWSICALGLNVSAVDGTIDLQRRAHMACLHIDPEDVAKGLPYRSPPTSPMQP